MPEAEAREIVVPHVHFLHDPRERFRGLLRIRDDGRDEMRDAGVGREFDPLGVDEHHAHLRGRRPHQQRGDHRVHEARLAGAGGSRNEQMRHFGEVRHDEATLDVLAETDRHGVNARGARLRAKHIAERHDLTIGVGNLDANRTLARDG